MTGRVHIWFSLIGPKLEVGQKLGKLSGIGNLWPIFSEVIVWLPRLLSKLTLCLPTSLTYSGCLPGLFIIDLTVDFFGKFLQIVGQSSIFTQGLLSAYAVSQHL